MSLTLLLSHPPAPTPVTLTRATTWTTRSRTTITRGTSWNVAVSTGVAASTLVVDDWTEDQALFTGYDTARRLAGAYVDVDALATYPQLRSTRVDYSLTGSSFTVEVVNVPNVSNGSTETHVEFAVDANNALSVGWSNGAVYARLRSAGVNNDTGYLGYDPVSCRFWRVSESGGTLRWEVSSDAISWRTLRAAAAPFPVGTGWLAVRAGNYNAAPTPGTARFRYVNTTGPAGTNRAFALGYATQSSPPTDTEAAEVATLSGAGYRNELWFRNWTWTPSATELNAVTGRGHVNVITWEFFDGVGPTNPTYTYTRLLAGMFDTYIDTVAAALRDWGGVVYLRPFHEMNGDWYPWCVDVNTNTRQQHIDAWRYTWNRFAAVGAVNVRWVWCPNILLANSAPFTTIYPGDPYVDVIAVDGYNFGDGTQYPTVTGTVWTDPKPLFDPTFTEIRGLGSARRWMIAETGSADAGGNKADWIHSLFDLARRTPELDALTWFHLNKERNWRFDSTEAARAAFAVEVAGQRVLVARSSTWRVRSRVTVSRGTTWGARGRVTITRGTTWAARSRVTVSRATTWAARSRVVVSRATTWAGRSRVTLSRGTSWSTRTPVAVTRATTWAARTRVAVTRGTSWTVNATTPTTPVTVTRGTTWGVRTGVLVARTTAWNTRTRVVTTRGTSWGLRQALTAARATSWGTRGRVVTTRSSLWAARARATVSRGVAWTVRGRVVTSQTATWSLRTRATVARGSSWVTRATVTLTRPVSWAVRGRVVPTGNTTTWGTRARVVVARSAVWGFAGKGTTLVAATWNVRGRVTPTRGVSWTVRTRTTVTRGTTWAGRTRVTATRGTSWSTRSRPTVTRAATWGTRTRVVTATGTSWSTSDRTRVTATRATTWRTRTRTTTTTAATWTVRARSDTTRPTTWTVLVPVTTTASTRWAVTTPTTFTRTARWDTYDQRTLTRTATWQVESERPVMVWTNLTGHTGHGSAGTLGSPRATAGVGAGAGRNTWPTG